LASGAGRVVDGGVGFVEQHDGDAAVCVLRADREQRLAVLRRGAVVVELADARGERDARRGDLCVRADVFAEVAEREKMGE
jgi:hypothetical protein